MSGVEKILTGIGRLIFVIPPDVVEEFAIAVNVDEPADLRVRVEEPDHVLGLWLRCGSGPWYVSLLGLSGNARGCRRRKCGVEVP